MCVDPGLVAWAYTIFQDGIPVASRTITYEAKRKLSQEERLADIFALLVAAGEINDVTEVVVERQFVDIMAQICGVVRAAAGDLGVKSYAYPPSSWKKACTGKGNISEEDLKQFVVNKFPEFENRSVHEIDCAGMYLGHKNKKAENAQAVKKTPKKRNVR